jgi:nucleotide-binding universal stress UspA family protein
MRILLATDGSPCSDVAIRNVAARPWPPGSELEVVTVVHTSMPLIPDPTLTGVAMRWSSLDEDRHKARGRVQAAEQQLVGASDLTVTGTVLEGDPAHAIVEEAARWEADLVVVGAHGYGVVKRLALGSVSTKVASHAPCSVEIVRCPHLVADAPPA